MTLNEVLKELHSIRNRHGGKIEVVRGDNSGGFESISEIVVDSVKELATNEMSIKVSIE